MWCGATPGLSGGKLARPVFDSELDGAAVLVSLEVAADTWGSATTKGDKRMCIPASNISLGPLRSILGETPKRSSVWFDVVVRAFRLRV